MGVTIEFDDLLDILAQTTLLTADDASINSFATALLERPRSHPQHAESAIPAAASAVAAVSSDGAAV